MLQSFPIKRIKPIDGLTVTAEVWEEAHDYHRHQHRFHAMLNHGAGIVAGLEVIASDPPDTSVYILPGVAIDSVGQTIALTEPMAYNIGRNIEGLLHLLLAYGESVPRHSQGREDGPVYIHSEFSIEAKPAIPETPCVELARIRRQGRESALLNAQDPAHPGANEIDLRFRRMIGVTRQEAVSLAVCYVGKVNEHHARGANYLAEAVRRSGQARVYVDDRVALDPDLEVYDLVYLIGQGTVQLSPDEMNTLYTYLKGGGTVFIETCCRTTSGADSPAEASMLDLLISLGIHLEPVRPGQRLMTDPFLFAAPPAGFESQGTPKLLVGEGVILSTYDYGCLWQGERRGATASREEIRSALEWGHNIIAYAIERRRQAGKA